MFDMVPFRSQNQMMKRGDSFDKFFDSFWTQPFGNMLQGFGAQFESFKVDVKDKGTSYELIAELPGVQKDAVSLDYRDNYLTIRAEKQAETESGEGQYICRERCSGSVSRSFYIDNVDRNQIDAAFQDGVLRVTLPKSAADHAEHRIEIH